MLFTPLLIGKNEISNRIVISPMCQYSALNGLMNDWHFQHLVQMGLSAAGLVMLESTAVEEKGRITNYCLGLYNDDCETSIKSNLENVKRFLIKQLNLVSNLVMLEEKLQHKGHGRVGYF